MRESGTIDLLTTMDKLLRLDDGSVDGMFADGPARERLFSEVTEICEQAYKRGDAHCLFVAQQVLAKIYDLYMSIPGPDDKRPESSLTVAGVRNLIERYFLEDEESRIPASTWEKIPREPAAYMEWLLDVVRRHPAYRHPLYEEYLGSRATLENLREFMIQETTIDTRFDDFLALVQVGTSGGVKLEIATNFWDEMGNGDESRMHTAMFDRAMECLGVNPDARGALTTEALVCGNISLLLTLRRMHFYKALGYFVVTEYLAPRRFEKVIMAWQRNGLNREGADYHLAHVSIDGDHASHWFENVIRPVISQSPEAVYDITRGAIYRLNTSQRYLDTVLAQVGR
jgi:hypothetical protein